MRPAPPASSVVLRVGVLTLCAGVLGQLSACAPDVALPPPTLSAILPAGATEGVAVDAQISGENFFATARRQLGEGVVIDEAFRAWLGELELANVTRQSDTSLAVQIPGTLPPGVYALSVETPNGTATLEGAFTVSRPIVTGPFPYAPSNFDPAQLPLPTGSVAVTSCVTGFDTTTESWFPTSCGGIDLDITRVTLTDGREATVLSTHDLSLSADSLLAFYGSRPVILAIFGDATLSGTLLANSTTGLLPRTGPGANPASCGAQSGGGGTGSRSGGGGGALATTGGLGGSAMTAGAAGGVGGVALVPLGATPLRGGCAGGPGGTGGPQGGAGGGGLQVSAAGALVVQEVVTASGGGGRGGASAGAGGSGGGSGGMVILEGATLSIGSAAFVTANGGGGAGGAGNGANAGSNGEDGPRDANVGGAGGMGATGAGSGGGGAGLLSGGTGGQDSQTLGAGGGGAGAGAVFLRSLPGGCSVQATAVVSPAPQKAGCP